MPQCPHCMSEIHEDATTCPHCGAMKGILAPGWTAERYRMRARPVLAFAAILAVIGLFQLGGSRGFGVFWLIMAALLGGLGFVIRSVLPSFPEKWYR